MVVDTMSYEELGRELLRFNKSNQARIVGLLQHKLKDYRRVVLARGEKRVDFKMLSFETDGNEVFVLPYSAGKSDFKKYGLSFYVIVRFFYHGQFWYANFDGRSDKVQVYGYHFFQRYIERHLKSNDKVGIGVVERYIRETKAITHVERVDNDKYEDCAYGSTSIGMCCGRNLGKVNIWFTFIDKSTIEYGLKKETFDVGSELVVPTGMDKFGMNVFKDEYYAYRSA